MISIALVEIVFNCVTVAHTNPYDASNPIMQVAMPTHTVLNGG